MYSKVDLPWGILAFPDLPMVGGPIAPPSSLNDLVHETQHLSGNIISIGTRNRALFEAVQGANDFVTRLCLHAELAIDGMLVLVHSVEKLAKSLRIRQRRQ